MKAPIVLTPEQRTRLLRLALAVTTTAAARVVAEEARVSPEDTSEFDAAETDRMRARASHEAALKAWYEASRAILLGEPS